WNNGIRTYRRTLLTEEGNGTYVDLDEMYNPDGDLIYMIRDDVNGHVYGEYYEYEDGIMTRSNIRDFLEMKATVTQYKNGEPELREIWSIDEEGVLVDLLETVTVN
ncbi:MAG: hypothetical protein J5796_02360, partial [Erysipelotrichaceae bacterium]|nr:hypothetical protein [Erysipelotrichaceae bacterium]